MATTAFSDVVADLSPLFAMRSLEFVNFFAIGSRNQVACEILTVC
jgi:hypothetical protein